MLKCFLRCGGIAIAAVLLAAPVRAATVIDFHTGGAGEGGWLSWDGSNVTGGDVPIGAVTIVNAPTGNGEYAVYGTAVGSGSQVPGGSSLFGDLDFATGSGVISLAGCIPGLGVGTFNPATGTCVVPVPLLTGRITDFDASRANQGLISAAGPDTKSPQLLAAVGLNPNTPFEFFGFSLATFGLDPDGSTSTAVSTDIRNTTVPEPTSLMLIGTGLLALFRARRRTV